MLLCIVMLDGIWCKPVVYTVVFMGRTLGCSVHKKCEEWEPWAILLSTDNQYV